MRNNVIKVLMLFFIISGILFSACTGPQETQNSKAPGDMPNTSGIAVSENTTTMTVTAVTTAYSAMQEAQSFIAVVNKITPCVMRIDVTGTGFSASGTGFFVDPRGYILTNHHVISNANQITVTLADGTKTGASVISSDANRDIALLKISSNRTDFPTVTLGSSAGVAVGTLVLASGFPLGTQLPGPVTFTHGIVSALRNFQGLNYIQIDAAVNPGNSGGPLVDGSTGQVLGIVTAGINPMFTDTENIGLAIPIDDTKSMIQNGVGK